MGFSEDEKEKLLKIARTTVEQVAKGKGIPDFEVESEALKKECGAFVSIHKGKDLRGCVGFIRACDPLYITVRNAAEAAAARDHRFSPLKKGELGRIKLEISVLSPLKKIENVDEIQVGRDGIVIRKGVNQGLLLPQVATEFDWDRTTFLEHTCLKANLPKDSWKDPEAEIWIFSADVFQEE